MRKSKMNRTNYQTLISVLVILLLASLADFLNPIPPNSRVINPNDQSDIRRIGGFKSLEVWGPFFVTVYVGRRLNESLKLSGNSDIIRNIETTVIGQSLNIRWIDNDKPLPGSLLINISTKGLKNLVASGAAQINLMTPVESDDFKLMVSGASVLSAANIITGTLNAVVTEMGIMNAKINCDNINAVVSVKGTMNLSGDAGHVNVVIAGLGTFWGRNLTANTVSATVSGSGKAEIFAKTGIQATITDRGVVRYTGTAKENEIATDIQSGGSFERF